MGQVTIYLDNEMEKQLKQAARAGKQSVSKWVASLIREKIATQWPDNIAGLAGSWQDDFPSLEEIRSGDGVDVTREAL